MNENTLRLSPKLAMVNLNYPRNIGAIGVRAAGGSNAVTSRQSSAASGRLALAKISNHDAAVAAAAQSAQLRSYDVNGVSSGSDVQQLRYTSPYEATAVIKVRPYSSHHSVTSPLAHSGSSSGGGGLGGGQNGVSGGSSSSGGGGRLYMNALSAKSLPAFTSANAMSNAASIYGRPLSKRASARSRECRVTFALRDGRF